MKRTTPIALAFGLMGCAADSLPDPGTPDDIDRAALEQQIASHIKQLNELDVFPVYDLVTSLPDEARQCYGVPCPGTPEEAAWLEERAAQATRLRHFVTSVEGVARCYEILPATALDGGS